MSINWPRLLARAGIEYTVSADGNNLTCHCPFCGSEDQAMHMAISVQGHGWHCWRNDNHRGRNPTRLLMRLLNCGFEEAQAIAGIRSGPSFGGPPNLRDVVLKSISSLREQPTMSTLHMLEQFHPLERTGLGGVFWEYLLNRDYTSTQIAWLAERYRLHYALVDVWSYRLIIPIYNAQGQLITWTARAVTDSGLRYKTLSLHDQAQPALAAPTSTLLGVEWLMHVDNARALVICEGPFDALRVSALGHKAGVFGTCLFGLNVSVAQQRLVAQLAERYEHIYLLLDTDAQMKCDALFWDRFAYLHVQLLHCPAGVEDPGALPQSAAGWVCSLAQREEGRHAEQRGRSLLGSANDRLDNEYGP